MSSDVVEESGPVIGVSLAFLSHFVKEKREAGTTSRATTNDYYEWYIKPATLEKQCSYVETLSKDTLILDHEHGIKVPATGQANIFVSHCWQYRFEDLVCALEQDIGSHEHGKVLFFWIDCFCANQHFQPTNSEWFSTNFRRCISKIGRVVGVISSWKTNVQAWEKICLVTRAWCIWELFCAIDTNAEVRLALREGSRESLKYALRTNFKSVMHSVFDFDLKEAKSTYPTDRDKIFDQIEKHAGGFEKMTQLLSSCLKKIIVITLAQLERWDDLLVLIQQGADVHAVDENGETALHHAAYCGEFEIVKALVEIGNANLWAIDKDGRIPFHRACSRGGKEPTKVIEFLFKTDPNILYSQNKFGRTPLHCAASWGRFDSVRWLLSHGSNVNAKDNDNQTAYGWALSYGFTEVAEYLKSFSENQNTDERPLKRFRSVATHICRTNSTDEP